jgi:hypothetical protein
MTGALSPSERERVVETIAEIKAILEPLSLYERGAVVHALSVGEVAMTMELGARSQEQTFEIVKGAMSRLVETLGAVVACNGNPERTQQAVSAVLFPGGVVESVTAAAKKMTIN